MKKLFVALAVMFCVGSACASHLSDLRVYYVDNFLAYHAVKIETTITDRLRMSLMPQVIVLPNVTAPIYHSIETFPMPQLFPPDPCRRPMHDHHHHHHHHHDPYSGLMDCR